MNRDTKLPTCAGFDKFLQIYECQSCPVPKYSEEAQKGLIQLIPTNFLHSKTF